MNPVSVTQARIIGKAHGLTKLVIIAIDQDSGEFGITTWGRTKAECRELAAWSERVGDSVVAGIEETAA